MARYLVRLYRTWDFVVTGLVQVFMAGLRNCHLPKMTKGQKAMAVAMVYPDAFKRGEGLIIKPDDANPNNS